MPKLYVKYVKFYDQDRDNFPRNLVTVVVKYATSPGRWLYGTVRAANEMVTEDLERLKQCIFDGIIDRHYGKSIKMIRRLKKAA